MVRSSVTAKVVWQCDGVDNVADVSEVVGFTDTGTQTELRFPEPFEEHAVWACCLIIYHETSLKLTPSPARSRSGNGCWRKIRNLVTSKFQFSVGP